MGACRSFSRADWYEPHDHRRGAGLGTMYLEPLWVVDVGRMGHDEA